MKNKHRDTNLFLLPFMMAVLTCSSCINQFAEINTNPHQATEEMMVKDNLSIGTFFVQMQKNVIPIAQLPDFGDVMYQQVQNLAGDIYSGYMGATGIWFSGNNNATYSMTPSWYGAAYDRAFLDVLPAWKAIKKAAEAEMPQALAIATIVKVVSLHRTTDMYGPLPYKNFGNAQLTTLFDSQKDIYYAFFDELTHAVNVLTAYYSKNSTVGVLAGYDFIYAGDVRQWILFANSLRLRLAMRIVYADPNKAKQEAEAAAAHPLGFLTKATDGAQLNHTAKMQYNHPLYEICFNLNDIRMGATLDSYMNGYKDPRLEKYFNKTNDPDQPFRGVRSGIFAANKLDYVKGKFSTLNIPVSFPIIWMQAAEVYFLRAEGVIRGWDMKGAAQELYEAGIKTSFDYWGANGYSRYINDAGSRPNAYEDAVNASNNHSPPKAVTIKWAEDEWEKKLERIMTQKYIAMYPEGQEAWSEFRRTGYPKVFPVVENKSNGLVDTDKQIRRLPFSQSLYIANPEMVNQAISLLGGYDNAGIKLWWDKKLIN